MLERTEKRLAPPKQLHGIEHSGEVNHAIRAMSDEEILERATDFSNRLLASVS